MHAHGCHAKYAYNFNYGQLGLRMLDWPLCVYIHLPVFLGCMLGHLSVLCKLWAKCPRHHFAKFHFNTQIFNKTNAQAIPPRRYGLQLHLCRISAI